MIDFFIYLGLGILVFNLFFSVYIFVIIQKIKNKNKKNNLSEYIPTLKSRDEVFSGEKIYDPNKIKGAFDEIFH